MVWCQKKEEGAEHNRDTTETVMPCNLCTTTLLVMHMPYI